MKLLMCTYLPRTGCNSIITAIAYGNDLVEDDETVHYIVVADFTIWLTVVMTVLSQKLNGVLLLRCCGVGGNTSVPASARWTNCVAEIQRARERHVVVHYKSTTCT